MPSCINNANITAMTNNPPIIPAIILRPILINIYLVKLSFSLFIISSASFHPFIIPILSLNIIGNTISCVTTYIMGMVSIIKSNNNPHNIAMNIVEEDGRKDNHQINSKIIISEMLAVEIRKIMFHLKNEFPINLFSLNGAFIDASFLVTDEMNIKLKREWSHSKRNIIANAIIPSIITVGINQAGYWISPCFGFPKFILQPENSAEKREIMHKNVHFFNLKGFNRTVLVHS